MNTSQQGTGQSPECSGRGRGRGRGIRGRGQKHHDSPRNSPTASRRPAQALYIPGAFNKHRKNTDSVAKQAPSLVETPGNVRSKNTPPKSEPSEITKSLQVDKSNLGDQQDCDRSRNICILEDENGSSNKLDVSSLTTNNVENRLGNRKENISSLLSNHIGKRTDNFDVCDAMVIESQPSHNDSTSDNITNSLPSDSAEQFIPPDCSASTVSSNVDNEIMPENCGNKENVCTKSEGTLLEGRSIGENIKTSHHAKLKCGVTTKNSTQTEMPAVKYLRTSSTEPTDSRIFPKNKSSSEKAMNERKNVIRDENQLAQRKIDSAVDSVTEHFKTNAESLAGGEAFSSMDDNNSHVEASVEVSGVLTPCFEVTDVMEEEVAGSSRALSDLNKEDDKIVVGNNESIVEIENIENVEEQSNSKQRQKQECLNDEDDESIVNAKSDGKFEVQSKSKRQCKEEDLNSQDDKITLGNNENMVGNESKEKVEAQRKSKKQHKKEDLNNEDGKIALGDEEIMVDTESEEKVKAQSKSKQQHKKDDLNNGDGKMVLGNSDRTVDTEKEGKVEAQSNLNDEHDKIALGHDEILENREKIESRSKSKRQCKKEERAKKKEERTSKKKQAKPKSEKTVKKNESEEKTTAKESEVRDLGKKGRNSKEVKIQQGKEKQANSIADDQELKIVRECKDTLLKMSVSEDHSLNHEDMGGEVGDQNRRDSAQEEEDWEAWDDGECLDENRLKAELDEHIDTTNVQFVKPQFDYLSFKPNDIILENGVFDHVVEIFGFGPEFKTHDLVNALSNFQQQGCEIHWVDDTHALAVFSNHRTAQQAVEQCSNPMLKLRSVYEGTQKSKLKAKRNVDILQPYKERPKTTKLVANRMVAGALGLRSKMTKEERQLEREKIKAERERKLNKEKQKKDLWESDDV